MTTMDEDHARDMASERRMRALRDELEVFLADPPYRARTSTEEAARGLLASVRQDMAHIVAVWN